MTTTFAAAALELRADQLRASEADMALPGCTDEISPLERVAGQERAQDALAFGLKLPHRGFNIAVSGPTASGRSTAALLLVQEAAAQQPAPSDWVYLFNFADPYRPSAVSLPPGAGDNLQRDLARLVDACRDQIPTAFEGDSYQERRQEALKPIQAERERLLEHLQQQAEELSFIINVTPQGFIAMPRGRDGKPLPAEIFQQLPEDVRADIDRRGGLVQEQVQITVKDLRRLDQRAHEAVRMLDRDVTRFIIGPILDDLREKYGVHGLAGHCTALEQDILEHLDTFRRFSPGAMEHLPGALLQQVTDERDTLLKRYTVNLFVTHGDQPAAHAPVVDENQPTYYSIFGRLDYQARFGSMTTDFTLIRPGAIHLANGGYLILQAQDLFTDPRTWIKLKRSLKTQQIRVEDIGDMLVPFPTVTLIPEPIPLNVKVVLVGTPYLFALLDAVDPDFADLFKIRAEFEPDTPNSPLTQQSYAAFVCRTVGTCGLKHFNQDALREILHYGNRLAGRQDRLSTQYGAIADLCQEASQIATAAGGDRVGAGHVRAAIDGKDRRSGLVPDRLRHMIAEGTLHVETSGAVVGQVNGLAVYQMGARAFGTPARITCRVGLGQRGVVDIEREVERSGAIHSKGVLVLSGYLAGTFGRRRPLAFNASLTFEQSYSEVDGDSASSAELYAILTALAEVPIRQDIAVTGSVDQFGRVQPVGGVTEKIEGFFDVCREVGLTGSQGVIIPRTNVVNLTLRPDVADAVRDGRFHVWAIARVEEGLELLTGLSAGLPDADGNYPDGAIFQRVCTALDEMAKLAGPPTRGRDGSAAGSSLPDGHA